MRRTNRPGWWSCLRRPIRERVQVTYWMEDVKMNKAQESMRTVFNYIRAIVEVCPRVRLGIGLIGGGRLLRTR